MDTKLKKKLKHYGTGIALLVVLTYCSLTSNSEFSKVRDWAKTALHTSNSNSSQLNDAQQQIDDNAAKIATLEADLKKEDAELAKVKKKADVVTAKLTPPKSYPKPPADFVPMNQKPPAPVKKHWWQIF
jgi:uncharacterized protein YcbK (DUF882 family)